MPIDRMYHRPKHKDDLVKQVQGLYASMYTIAELKKIPKANLYAMRYKKLSELEGRIKPRKEVDDGGIA